MNPRATVNAPLGDKQTRTLMERIAKAFRFKSTKSPSTLLTAASEDREDQKGSVGGLTVLGDKLFLIRFGSQGTIEVYIATNCTFQRNIEVKELEGVSYITGLTSCDSNNCLYVSYWHRFGYIARVELTGDNKVVKWKVIDGEPRGLSVNSEHNLMVACGWQSHKLIEYTTRGELVREILLKDEFASLWHAVQLNSQQFLVCHGYEGSLHRVCVVDVHGRVLLSYGNTPGSGSGQLNEPHHVAVDRDGLIFVADRDNNRIVVLDSTLKWSRDLKIDGGVKYPHSLHLDKQRNLLFIGEENYDESRVAIVKCDSN